jgi:hypothetical protein
MEKTEQLEVTVMWPGRMRQWRRATLTPGPVFAVIVDLDDLTETRVPWATVLEINSVKSRWSV